MCVVMFQLLDFRYLPLALHVFRLHSDRPLAEELEDGEDTAYSNWTLPAGQSLSGNFKR